MRRVIVGALVAVLALAVGAGAGWWAAERRHGQAEPTSPTKTSESPSPAPSSSQSEVPVDLLAWERCTVATGAECATLEVPMDWDNPQGEKIELAMARIPASDQANRIGSL
ncbi:MAG: hypothetical protein LBG11_08720, partial [Bifidobacteriaceae bacterium]|nr:hypothetical protein [Bifidobacteriaceae bacterium]